MPRRRPTKGHQSRPKPKSFKKSDSSIEKWNTLEDIPMDDEDAFHASKDKILLEGDDAGGHSDDGDEDEVFALKGVNAYSDDDDGVGEYDFDDDQEGQYEEESGHEPTVSAKKDKKSKQKTKSKGKGKAQDSADEKEQDSEQEEESWGQGRAAYYSSNANQIDSDDEEANEMEEQEARRLQLKLRQEMDDADFGLNDDLGIERQMEELDILETEPHSVSALPQDKQSIIRHLEKTNPESLALARDWDDTLTKLQKTRSKIEKLEEEKSDTLSLGMIHIHYQTLLSYSTVLAFYLHLRASPKYAKRPSLFRSHPIMQRLLTLKQALHTLEDLDFAVSEGEDDDDSNDAGIDLEDMFGDAINIWQLEEPGGLDADELGDLLKDAETPLIASDATGEKPPKKKRKVAPADDAEKLKGPSKPKSTKSKIQAKAQPVAPVFDLVEPEFVSSKSSSNASSGNDMLDAFGEVTSLSAVDAADKNVRKKSLRFHTSKIESAAARRQAARNRAIGGDDDIPYRERKREKDARLVAEAAKRAGREDEGADLDEEEPEARAGQKRARDEEDAGSEGDADDYYELVKRKSKEVKERKKAEYEEVNGLSRVPLEDDSSGPRSLTRAILKNRGLTPSRPKSVRNPRVKKRQKFDKAKKKLSSQKAMYKGGLAESKGRYDGEKTGISKVVKSVRLG